MSTGTITDVFVVPPDVTIVPVVELSPELRRALDAPDDEFLVTRPGARSGSRVVDEPSADLLERFRSPARIVDAVIAFSQQRGEDPARTLEDAYPMLQRLIDSGVLVAADSGREAAIGLSLTPGDRFAGWEVVAPIQVLEDTELHQVRGDDGTVAALKLFVAAGRPHVARLAAREAALLEHLAGDPAPRLLAAGEEGGRPYLVLEWIAGVPARVAADELRREDARAELAGLCCAITDAYVRLHARGVLHSDVHPDNLLVGPDGAVRLLDFGVARIPDSADPLLALAPRAGIPFYFEPEYATAVRAGQHAPPSSFAGEQHALASLLHVLVTGSHPHDFALEQGELLRQIAEDPPQSFTAAGVAPWPELEAVLAACLAKRPEDRLPDVAALARALDEVVRTAHPAVARPVELGHAHALVDAVLARVGPDGPFFPTGMPVAPTSSVNYGAAGIAYALYRLAGLRSEPELLASADVWCTRALAHRDDDDAWTSDEIELTAETVGPISALHTAAGAWCVAALVAHARGDSYGALAAVQEFIDASVAPCANLDLTLGRASTLLACAQLLEALGPDVPALIALGDQTLAGIWAELDAYASVSRAPELRYLGIAHGWAGILYATLRWSAVTRSAPPATLPGRLAELAQLAEPHRRGCRWPVVAGGREHMAGWCNGSAGHVYLWALADQVYRDPRFGALAQDAAWNAWEADDQIGQLCCGRGGRAYALLALHRHTGDAAWLHRARVLASRAAAQITPAESEGRVDSLYKGSVGIALLAAEQADPELARMPFFEAHGWPAVKLDKADPQA